MIANILDGMVLGLQFGLLATGLGGVQDVRVSVPADPFELPAMPKHLDEKPPHQHHLENFFDTVRSGGKQSDLNCPVAGAYKCARAVLAINDAVEQQKRIEFKPEDFQVA